MKDARERSGGLRRSDGSASSQSRLDSSGSDVRHSFTPVGDSDATSSIAPGDAPALDCPDGSIELPGWLARHSANKVRRTRGVSTSGRDGLATRSARPAPSSLRRFAFANWASRSRSSALDTPRGTDVTMLARNSTPANTNELTTARARIVVLVIATPFIALSFIQASAPSAARVNGHTWQ